LLSYLAAALLLISLPLVCACAAPVSGQGTGGLRLRVELVTGERSKDSSSQTTTISIASPGKTIVWEQTYGGHHGGASPPARGEYKLSSADARKLIGLLESKSLLATNSIELPEDPSTHLYFALSVETALDGKQKGAVNIRGPRTAVAVKEKTVYRDAVALVKELYQIINRQGGHVVFDEPVMPTKKLPAQSNRPPVAPISKNAGRH
jgi:hypothetical protein